MVTVFDPIANMMPGIASTLPYFSGGLIMYVVYQRFGATPCLSQCTAWIPTLCIRSF
jgi:hypothetical protein